MAREDVHGAALQELYSTTETPLSLTEASEIVGASKQRAYAWADTKRTWLIGVATGARNAVQYFGRTNPHLGTWARGNDQATTEDLTVGSTLTVSGMVVKGGRVVLRLAAMNGDIVEAMLI